MKFRRILLLCLLIGLAVLSGCDGPTRLTSEEYLQRAKVALQAEDVKGAIVDLKQALQYSTDHREARLLLGKAYLDLGYAMSAEKELIRARSLGATATDIQPELARALLMQEKYKEVLATDIPVQVQADVLAKWLEIQGHALLAQNKNNDAAFFYQQALQTDKYSRSAALGLARVDFLEKRFDASGKRLNELLSRDDKYAPAWRLLGELERMEGRLEEAESAYTKAIENDAANEPDIITRCLVRIALKKFSEASEDISGLRSRGNRNPLLDYAEGLLLFQQRRYPDAQLAFEQVLKIDRQYPPALFYAGTTHLVMGNTALAEEYLGRYQSSHPGHVLVQKMLVVARLHAGDTIGIEELARAVLRERPDDVFILNLLADLLVQQQRSAEGLEYLKEVVVKQSDSALARERLASGLIRQGDVSGGIEELERVLKLDHRIQEAGARLVLLHLEKGEHERALEKALELREKTQDLSGAHIILGLAYLSMEKLALATEAFRQANELEPDNMFVLDGFVDLAVASDETDKAKMQFRATLEAQPGHLGALLGLARIAALQGDVVAMKSLLGEANRLNPQALEPYQQLGRYYLQAGEADRVAEVLAEIRGEYPRNQALLELQAQSELAVGHYKLARATLQELEKIAPDSVRLHNLLASCYAGLGEPEKVHAELTRVVELDPGHTPAHIALARLMLEQHKEKLAETHIKTLRGVVGGSVEVLMLEGQLAAQQQKMQQAIAAFRQAFELESSNRNLVILSRSRWAAGDRQGSVKDLRDWVQKHPQDALIQFELAQRYLDMQRDGDALDVFEKVVELSPKNYVVLNNLAWLLQKQDPARALEYAEQASLLAPQSLSVQDTLALVLLANGDTVRAWRIITRALEKHPGQPSLVYHQAMILEASARRDEAIELLNRILAEDLDFPERAQAESLLASLSGA